MRWTVRHDGDELFRHPVEGESGGDTGDVWGACGGWRSGRHVRTELLMGDVWDFLDGGIGPRRTWVPLVDEVGRFGDGGRRRSFDDSTTTGVQ